MLDLLRLTAARIAVCLAFTLAVWGLLAHAPPEASSMMLADEGGSGDNAVGSIIPSDSERYDFVKSLQEYNDTTAPLYASVIGDRNIDVLVPFNGGRYAHYSFRKDDNDDFIKLQNGAVSVLDWGGGTCAPRGAVKLFETLHPWSNKEFAINVAPEGTSRKAQWIPEHSGVGTAFSVSQNVYFDDMKITAWTPDKSLKEVETVKIEQRLKAIFPDDPNNPIADIESLFLVDKHGVSIKAKITWLQKATITAGYGMMFPVLNTFADKLVTSYGNAYDATATDGSITNLKENDRASSYAFIHTSGGTNGESGVMAAMNVDDIAKTFRYGEAGRRAGGSIVWLQHRDNTMQKLYPHVYQNHLVNPGDTYEASGRFFVGEMPPVFGEKLQMEKKGFESIQN